jgi:hypothetical protein
MVLIGRRIEPETVQRAEGGDRTLDPHRSMMTCLAADDQTLRTRTETTAMIHDVVDLDRWIGLFPLDRLRADARAKVEAFRERDEARWIEATLIHSSARPKYGRATSRAEAIEMARADRDRDPADWDRRRIVEEAARRGAHGETIVSPYDLAVVTQLRAELVSAVPVGEGVPTDIFVWAKGEPRRREVTKIGGLPYWPAGKPWPEMRDGAPMHFVGQFCFADSLDIVGALPGGVLTIFAPPRWEDLFRADGYMGDMIFDWFPIGLTDLISPDSVPSVSSNWPISPYYGEILRTSDFMVPAEEDANFGWEHPDWSDLGLLNATKIGGIPWWEQLDPGLPGRFLCALESIQPAFGVPFPYLNVPEPIGPTFREQYPDDDLMWGDLGRLYLQFDGERVYWEMQCG